jgi:hypothetical protein
LPLKHDLLVQVILRLLLHLSSDLLAHAFAFLHQLLLLQHVLAPDHHQIVGQLLLLGLLLLNPRLLALDGQVELLLFGQASDLEMSTFAVADQMCGHVLEDRVQRLQLWSSY